MVPVITPNTLSRSQNNRDKAIEAYTFETVKRYLDSDILDDALNQLEKARIEEDGDMNLQSLKAGFLI